MNSLKSALAGVKVLDLSRILAGPWCAQNLSDLGAEVTKVEGVEAGDDTRGWGPPFLTADAHARLSAYFVCCNCGKRSIAVDFAQASGADLVRQLAASSDVLIENFKSGSLAKFGLDYASLRKINPRLVYISITGFGQDGPMAGRPGYDYVFQGMTGLMSYTGIPNGLPGAGPLRTGVAVVDLMTGMYATMAVQAALWQRERTGQGQQIDVALLDVGVALNANQAMNYLVSGDVPPRTGNAHPNCAPYEVFACRDGHMILAIGNDSQFARFCAVSGRNDLGSDPRYRTNAGRIEHLSDLRVEIALVLAQRDRADWGEALEAAGVPWGPIRQLDEVFSDAQVRHRHVLQHLTHARMGPIPSVRNPVLPPVPTPDRRPPPLLGEHTDQILSELGCDAEKIADLKRARVVA